MHLRPQHHAPRAAAERQRAGSRGPRPSGPTLSSARRPGWRAASARSRATSSSWRRQGAAAATKRRSGQASQSAWGEKRRRRGRRAAAIRARARRQVARPCLRPRTRRGRAPCARGRGPRSPSEPQLAQPPRPRLAHDARGESASASTRSAAGSSRRHSARRDTSRRLDQQLVAAQAADDRPARSAAGSASRRRAAPCRPPAAPAPPSRSPPSASTRIVSTGAPGAARATLADVVRQRDEQRARGEARLALELLERAARGGHAERAADLVRDELERLAARVHHHHALGRRGAQPALDRGADLGARVALAEGGAQREPDQLVEPARVLERRRATPART